MHNYSASVVNDDSNADSHHHHHSITVTSALHSKEDTIRDVPVRLVH
jgi:hypothetical protein